MPSRRHIRLFVAAVFALGSFALIAEAQGESSMSDQKQIVKALNTVFATLHADDSQELNSVLTPNFYIFEGRSAVNRGLAHDAYEGSVCRGQTIRMERDRAGCPRQRKHGLGDLCQ
jgi:hypothetical protein